MTDPVRCYTGNDGYMNDHPGRPGEVERVRAAVELARKNNPTASTDDLINAVVRDLGRTGAKVPQAARLRGLVEKLAVR